MRSDSFAANLARLVPQKLLLTARRAFLTWQVASERAKRESVMDGLRFLVKPGDHVADLGANIGIYALELSRLVGAEGRVYSLEPLSENFRILEGVVRSKRLANVRVRRAAIGARARSEKMVIPKAVGFFGGFYTAHLAQDGEQGEAEFVDVVRLDDLRNGDCACRFDFVRADVPGAELQVIEGGASVFALRPGVLLGVPRRNREQVFERMKSMGYRAFLYTDRFEEAHERVDAKTYLYFFLHPDSRCWEMARKAKLLSAAG